MILLSEPLDEFVEKVESVLQRCRERGITLSKKKFDLGMEVRFAGYLLSGHGTKADPEKVSSIVNFRTPKLP